MVAYIASTTNFKINNIKWNSETDDVNDKDTSFFISSTQSLYIHGQPARVSVISKKDLSFQMVESNELIQLRCRCTFCIDGKISGNQEWEIK